MNFPDDAAAGAATDTTDKVEVADDDASVGKALDGGQPDPDPVLELQGRAERAEEALSAANGQLLLVVEKLRELGLEPEGDYAIGEAAALLLGALAEKVAALTGDLELEAARAEKAERQIEAEAAKPKAAPVKGGNKLRKINAKAVKLPLVATQDAAGNVTAVAAQLAELIAIADTVEVVCSDGQFEIAGIAAQRISGSAWRQTQVGLQLTLEQLLVSGPAVSAPPYAIRGYGLLLDRDLVHFQPRSEPLEVMGGGTSNIAPDVCFS